MNENRRASRVLAGIGAVAIAVGGSCFLITRASEQANRATPREVIGPPAPASAPKPDVVPVDKLPDPSRAFLSTSKSLSITPPNSATEKKAGAPAKSPVKSFLFSSKSAIPPSLRKAGQQPPAKGNASQQIPRK